MSFWVQVEEIWAAEQERAGSQLFSFLVDGGTVALTRRLWKTAMGSELSYFSPQGEGGTRPALPQLPIRAKDLGLQVHTP